MRYEVDTLYQLQDILICGSKFTIMGLARHLFSLLSCYAIESKCEICRAENVLTRFACKVAS